MKRVERHVIQPAEYEELPELTDEMFPRGVINKGGRPRSENPKRLISIRLTEDVIQRWRATGPGWQTRMAESSVDWHPNDAEHFARSDRIRRPLSAALTLTKRLGATIVFMIDWSTCAAVEQDPSRVSGAWVFRGTRVPVAALFENLEDGASVNDFVLWFPGVSVGQVRAVLEHAARSAMAVA
jgi:uncharacterized protein (DUF4415 family)/uncharacterized protein (DUF433 family)